MQEEEGVLDMLQEGLSNICQLDGNATTSSLTTSDEESETESENDDPGNSSEEDDNEDSLSENEEIICDESEDNTDVDNDTEPANNIPIMIGFRPPPIIQDTRHL